MTVLLWVLLAGNITVVAGLVIWAVRTHRVVGLLRASMAGLAHLQSGPHWGGK
jgi:hypothetical protein